MNSIKKIVIACALTTMCLIGMAQAQPAPVEPTMQPQPEKIRAGVYVTDIYDLDEKSNSYKIVFWVWTHSKSDGLWRGLKKMLEIPHARTYSFLNEFTVEKNGVVWSACKIGATIYQEFHLEDYPFDRHELILKIDSSSLQSEDVKFALDVLNSKLHETVALKNWKIKESRFDSTIRAYPSSFGNLNDTNSEYGRLQTHILIERDSPWALFFKKGTAVMVSAIVAAFSFCLTMSQMSSRISICMGALFGCIASKYVTDSTLGVSSASSSIIEKVHNFSLIFVLCALVVNILYAFMNDGDSPRWKRWTAKHYDKAATIIFLAGYTSVLLLIVFNRTN